MSSVQLLASAKIIRDKAVNEGQRILNNVWLTMEQSKTYEGAKALGRLMSIGEVSYRRALTPAEINNPFTHIMHSYHEDALIAHFKYHDIEVSKSGVILNLKHRF